MRRQLDSLSLRGEYIATLRSTRTGRVTREVRAPNIVTRSGRNQVARMLLDVASYDVGLTWQAIGDGTTAPNVRNTSLVNELVRREVTSRQDTSGVTAAFFTFFPAADVPDTIEEVGMFGHDAGMAPGSGVMFSRALLSIAGASAEDLLLSYVLTVN